MTDHEPRVKRHYQSSLRQIQAKATRLTIVQAATRLFVAQGYVRTSMDDIAVQAGVSRATVFSSVGGKAAILKATYDIAVVGDDEPVPLAQRPWALAVRNERDPVRMIEGYAALITQVSGRVAEIYEAIRGAAAAEPEARDMWHALRGERRGGAGTFVGFLAALDAIPPGLDHQEAADIVWVLNDPALYYLVVHERGWSSVRFQSWLGSTMKCQLLGEHD